MWIFGGRIPKNRTLRPEGACLVESGDSKVDKVAGHSGWQGILCGSCEGGERRTGVGP